MNQNKLPFDQLMGQTIDIIVRFPRYFLLPILAELVLYLTNLYLTFTIPLFKEISLFKTIYSFVYLAGMALLSFVILYGYLAIIKKWTTQAIQPEWEDFLGWDFTLFWRFFLLSLLITILSFVGLLFLIVPGIIIASNYLLAPYILIDSGSDFSKAMEESKELIKPVKWSIFWLVFGYTAIVMLPTLIIMQRYAPANSLFLGPIAYLTIALSMIFTHLSKIFLAFLYFMFLQRIERSDKLI